MWKIFVINDTGGRLLYYKFILIFIVLAIIPVRNKNITVSSSHTQLCGHESLLKTSKLDTKQSLSNVLIIWIYGILFIQLYFISILSSQACFKSLSTKNAGREVWVLGLKEVKNIQTMC